MHELHDIPKGSTLGVNYTRLHDSAIAVVGPDGATRFACSLERLSRLKQDGRQPDELLQELPWDAIDQVAIASSTFEDATALGVEHRDQQWPWRRKSREWELTVAHHPDGCEAFYAGLKKPQRMSGSNATCRPAKTACSGARPSRRATTRCERFQGAPVSTWLTSTETPACSCWCSTTTSGSNA